MKRLFLLALVFASCSVKNYPLKGSYPETPMVFTSSNSFEKTWDKLIDVFAQKGLAIKIIDKSSGLIVSSNSRMSATPEDANGKLVVPTAYIAVPSLVFAGVKQPVSGQLSSGYGKKQKVVYNDVFGEWNVRVKPTDNGGSTINVNITNVNYSQFDIRTKSNILHQLSDYHSTGVFEKELSDLIK